MAWSTLDTQDLIIVPARPANGIWTMVRTYVSGPLIIQLQAEGSWSPVAGLGLRPCSADGYREWIFGRDMLLTKRAPLGALIGKIGGSAIATDEGDILVIGSMAVVTVDKASGPLYLTINDAPMGFDDNTGQLTVTLS